MNIGVHVSLSDLVSSVCMHRSGIAGSYGSRVLYMIRETSLVTNYRNDPGKYSLFFFNVFKVMTLWFLFLSSF